MRETNRIYLPETRDMVMFLPDGRTRAGDRFEVLDVADGQLHLADWGWGDLGAKFWDDAKWDDGTPKYVVLQTAEERVAEELMQ